VQGTPGDVHVSQDLNRLLNVTDKLAQQRKDDYIPTELVVLASFEDKHTLAKLLKDAGASKAAIEQAGQARELVRRSREPLDALAG
jgi:ATP-dependent Clp protease ATP-binding subunit ClpB